MHKMIFTRDNLHILFVLNLVGEGEWLREVEERAGESRRALWGVKSSQEQESCHGQESYLWVRRPVYQFRQVLLQSVKILWIRQL